jgi:hypothetical protein
MRLKMMVCLRNGEQTGRRTCLGCFPSKTVPQPPAADADDLGRGTDWTRRLSLHRRPPSGLSHRSPERIATGPPS